MKNTVVLYHNGCTDGFSGAWAARKVFGKKADYIGVKHHEAPPLGLDDKDVYIIDFSYPENETKKLLEITKSLVQLDHHVTVKEITESIPDHLYALDHSGATLAWQYFFPKEETPTFLKYVEDIDLWKFKMPRAEDFLSFADTISFDFDKFDTIVADFENEKKRSAYLDRGKNLREYQDKLMSDIIENGEEAIFDGYSALVVNSPILRSQLGNEIVKKGYDIGVVWSDTRDIVRVSLRSDANGEVNVGEIAKKYGGGGHKSSAGIELKDESEFPWQAKNS